MHSADIRYFWGLGSTLLRQSRIGLTRGPKKVPNQMFNGTVYVLAHSESWVIALLSFQHFERKSNFLHFQLYYQHVHSLVARTLEPTGLFFRHFYIDFIWWVRKFWLVLFDCLYQINFVVVGTEFWLDHELNIDCFKSVKQDQLSSKNIIMHQICNKKLKYSQLLLKLLNSHKLMG